jgi:hypothetical protein
MYICPNTEEGHCWETPSDGSFNAATVMSPHQETIDVIEITCSSCDDTAEYCDYCDRYEYCDAHKASAHGETVTEPFSNVEWIKAQLAA